MAQFFFKLSVLVIASILLILPGTNLRSQAIDTKQVLILNSYDEGAAPYFRSTEVFRAELQMQFGEPISFYHIDLDARGNDAEKSEDLVAKLLRNRYADVPPDIVFANGPPAITFWINYRDSISGQAPLIAVAKDGLFAPEDLRPGDVTRFSRWSFSDSVDDILRLRPETSHILMVLGSSPRERAIADLAKKELSAHTERLRVEYTNDMTLREVQVRLQELSKESVVFYTIFNVDAAGVILPRDTGLSATRSVSAAPVFGGFVNQIGKGIVGGRLIQSQEIGLEAAAAGIAILHGEPVRDAWKVIELSAPIYDFRELERWGIDFERLPAGSEIWHKPLSVWDQYAAWIILATTVVVAQGLLIISLITQRRRCYAAELMQRKLSGQLIHAHEDERRAIARELHDDLSQRLARLAIDAGTIRHGQNSATLDDELKNLREDLARVSEDVHDMSYRMHPSIVEDLGISTALRTECQRMRKYTDVPVKDHIGETHGRIPNNVALCAFRVVQEALNNAVRHARADSIEIVFEKEGHVLKLEVSDDGRGFDKAQVMAGESIGLSSMRERVRLLDGTLSIRSKPGAGTTVSAVIPLTGDNP